MAKKFERGDHVAYARAWLRNTCQFTGDVPHMRGHVIEREPFGSRMLITVQWTMPDGRIPISKVLDCNLVHVDRIHKELA